MYHKIRSQKKKSTVWEDLKPNSCLNEMDPREML
jgi:hypothetical protein